MRRRRPVLEPGHMEQPSLKFYLLPAQRYELRHPQAVAIGQEHDRFIPTAVAPGTTGSRQELANFLGGQVLPGAHLGIAPAPRRNSPENGVWRGFPSHWRVNDLGFSHGRFSLVDDLSRECSRR